MLIICTIFEAHATIMLRVRYLYPTCYLRACVTVAVEPLLPLSERPSLQCKSHVFMMAFLFFLLQCRVFYHMSTYKPVKELRN